MDDAGYAHGALDRLCRAAHALHDLGAAPRREVVEKQHHLYRLPLCIPRRARLCPRAAHRVDVEVKIPAGVAEGMQLSVNGKGNAGKHNGVPGDLLVVIEEESHPDLIRDENDLIYNLLLSVPTAALGGTVEIPTIDSKVKVKIEPGTQPGKVLRLRGKGLPNVNSYGYSNGTGDLLVNVSVYIPETLNKDEKQALEKMQESDNFKPNTSIKEKIFKKFKNFFD